MQTETQIWQGIKVKSTTIDPRYDMYHEAYVIGYNPFTWKFIVCDSEGYVKHSCGIRNYDGTELSKQDYARMINEIKTAGIQALSGLRDTMSTYK
jgi:hypothetical protein